MHHKSILSAAMVCAGALGVAVLCGGAVLSKTDTQFMKMAAEANMTEAHVGQMAEAQGLQQGVKDFGATLSKDHTASYESLTKLANETGEKIPVGIDVRRDKNIERLIHLKGASFDRAFVLDEVQSHKQAVAAFKNEAEHGENANVRAWAKMMIPTLEGHVQMAENLVKEEKTAKRP